jgi:hypothetical protein
MPGDALALDPDIDSMLTHLEQPALQDTACTLRYQSLPHSDIPNFPKTRQMPRNLLAELGWPLALCRGLRQIHEQTKDDKEDIA